MRAVDTVTRARLAHERWLIAGVAFLAGALTIGTSNYAFGLFVQPLEAEFGWQRTAISASLSLMAISSVTAPLIGRMMDRYGARPVMTASLAIFALSFALRPLMTELWHLYALSLLQFVGFYGAALLPAGRLVAIWFPTNRGTVMGVTMMGNNFGGLVVPLAVGLVLAIASWQAAFVTIAAFSFALTGLALALVHENPPPSVLDGDTARDRDASSTELTGSTVGEALRTRNFYAMTLALTLASFAYSTILPHVSAFLTDEDVPRTGMLTAVALMATFGMIGKLFFGRLAENISARRAMMVSLGGQVTFILALVAEPSLPWVWISAPLYGFCMGGHGVLVTLLIQDTFGLRYYGSISGLTSIPTIVPLVGGPLLAGASSEITGSYTSAFVIVAATFAVGIVTLTQVRRPSHEGWPA